jgi:hypothetical protein
MESTVPIDPPEYPAAPDLALSALLQLMTRFNAAPSFAKAGSILAHLQLVAGDPRHAPALRETAARLADEWRRRDAAPCGGGLLTH